MGSGRWDSRSFAAVKSSAYSTMTTDQIYKERKVVQELDPRGISLRESRDSKDNPNSTAVIIGLDVTGSMDSVLDVMAREGLNKVFEGILERRPIADPHIMLMGIGDVNFDRTPLQASQFEADLRISDQLEQLYLERGGGGNRSESYHLPWYFAAERTSIDCFLKRGKKGYLFTIGDEEPPENITADQLKRVFGTDTQFNPQYTAKELLDDALATYEVFHIMVEEGYNFQRYPDSVVKKWTALLGERAMRLSDHRKLGELIVSAIQINEGMNSDTVVKSWDNDTSKVVGAAMGRNVVIDEEEE
jgi:hypothetical protein